MRFYAGEAMRVADEFIINDELDGIELFRGIGNGFSGGEGRRRCETERNGGTIRILGNW